MLCLPERPQVRLLAAPTGRGLPFPANYFLCLAYNTPANTSQNDAPIGQERRTAATGSCEWPYLQTLSASGPVDFDRFLDASAGEWCWADSGVGGMPKCAQMPKCRVWSLIERAPRQDKAQPP
ncbi:hypothetical protein UY3_14264 [Chelonia mydas]|uniref:Uncharacterized protein n=1 Tax=Chelonia mydas TaxID=8469 RepID=M7BK94_CHEMY|nr:hypothetical protein UY3_14264 [Chelonia mydas]